ncbi:MAG TPA: acyltransferase family protein [Acidimicrobiia bacterium]|nr:acyltransferase family protein [Acidimicrobiia bacterium]
MPTDTLDDQRTGRRSDEAPRAVFPHQPALDGLRAVAVLAVIAYHLGYGWAAGGYLGVDAFFVLSGYLITSLLLVEYAAGGRIDLTAFWARRARRLLPALLLVLTAVSVWAALELRPDQLGNLRGDGLATLFYGANWRFVASGQSYFDVFSSASPLRHAWSLAIEEQFYLVWPLVVLACLRLARGRARLLAGVCVGGAAVSIALMAAVYDPTDPSRAYYGTDTRAHALLVGALLAILLRHRGARAAGPDAPPRAGRTLQIVGTAAALGCIAAFALIPDTSGAMYRGGFAAFAVAVALLIAAAVAPGPSPLRQVLSVRPLRFLGTISYGLYLWHWPVQVALDETRTGLSGVGLDAARIVTTFTLATLSFAIVERPIRRGALRRRAYAAAPLAFVGVVSAVLLVTAAAVPPPAYLRNRGDASIRAALHDLPVAAASATAPAPAPTTTPPAAPAANPANPPVTFAPRRVLLVGDSVMASLQPALRAVAAARGVALASIAVPGCGTIAGEPLGPGDARYSWTAGCGRNIPDLQSSAVAQNRPDVVVWLSGWESADRILGDKTVRIESPDGFQTVYDLVDQAVQRLTSTGARVAFLTMPPQTSADDVAHPSTELQRRYRLMDELLEWYAYRHPATTFVVDLSTKVCPGGPPCPEVVDGVRLRPVDGHHFSADGGAAVAPWILDQVTTPRAMASHN